MSATGLEVFDTTLQKTMIWLKEIMDDLHWEERHRAYLALRGSLHQIRDHLPVEEAAHFSAQLPLLVRGMYYEGWDPTANPRRDRSAAEAVAARGDYFPPDMVTDYERVLGACLRVVSRQIDPGMTPHLIGVLPKWLAALWEQSMV